MIKVRLVHGYISRTPVQKKTLAALGLRKIGMEKTFPDNPAVRGMIERVKHLVEVIS